MNRPGALDIDEFSKLTTTLFSAAIGQVSWDAFLDDLSKRGGDICTHILGFDLEANIAIEMAASGYDPDYLATYDAHFEQVNAWAPGFAAHPAGIAVDCEAMCPTEDLVKTEFYHDWLRPQEEIIQGGGALLFKSDTRLFALGGNIRQRDSDKLKDPWMRLVQHLVPHMRQAFEVSRALAGRKLETAIVAGEGLRQVPGIVLLSDAGRVVFSNDVAQSMLDKGDPISTDRRETLCIGSGPSERRITADYLQHRLSAVAPSFSVEVPAAAGGTTFQLRFAKFTPEAQIALPLDATLGLWGRCTLLLISEAGPAAGLVTQMQDRFGLTRAEAEVAALVADGLNSRVISESREVSIHTVRHQIKAAMAKVGVHRQTELVREIQRFAASHSPFGG